MDAVKEKLKPIALFYEARVAPIVSRVQTNPAVLKASELFGTYLPTVARLMICLYFANLSITNLNYWYKYNVPGFPFSAFPELPCAILVAFNKKVSCRRAGTPAACCTAAIVGAAVCVGASVRCNALSECRAPRRAAPFKIRTQTRALASSCGNAVRHAQVHIFGIVLVVLAAKDALAITYTQLALWLVHGHELYINELMVKKFSMTGAMVMVLVNDPYFKTTLDHTSKALKGLVLTDEPKFKVSARLSVVLLIVRMLLSTLFLYVGYMEVKRQLMWNQGVVHHGHVHHRAAGDGHNNMWPKLAEFALALPFVVGFKTHIAAAAIAICLTLEALIYWNWLSAASSSLGLGYSIHARDHFSVNVGVAGGLLLLQTFGSAAGGRYSVDELIKKKGD
eukprot:TRINITY_DN184_c0_g2_i1.p1 TRINITY_DN184_c0_g2~~TRINITY_DN184_c0_g2_i1.p1  ORF type:complete len:401 (+),score=136.37 TRINITY_DN184_c0_g2_i1:24-1205(+)